MRGRGQLSPAYQLFGQTCLVQLFWAYLACNPLVGSDPDEGAGGDEEVHREGGHGPHGQEEGDAPPGPHRPDGEGDPWGSAVGGRGGGGDPWGKGWGGARNSRLYRLAGPCAM